MNRKLVTLIGAALLAAGATAAVALGGGSSSPKTLDLAVDGQHGARTFVDAAPLQTKDDPNDSPGDTIVLHAPLVDTHGARVGIVDATFVTTAPGADAQHDGSEQLTGTLKLRGGQIAVVGTVGAYAPTSHVAVVGGTSRYAGACGDVTAQFSPRAATLHLSFS